MDYTALKTELTTDPLSVGYAASAGNFPALATLINAVTGNGAATVTLPSLPNAAFVTAFLPYLSTALELPAPKGSFYAVLWQTILAMPTIDFTATNVQGLMAQAVADGVLTSDQATALNQRTGSRAEVLFGAGTQVQWQDISQAILGA